MPVTVQWDNDAKTAILYTFAGHWSWDEFRTTWMDGRALVSSVPHQVASILCFERSAGIPAGMLVKGDHVFRNRLPNAGHVILVSGGALINMLVTTFKAMNQNGGKWVLTASSLAAARAKLAELQGRDTVTTANVKDV